MTVPQKAIHFETWNSGVNMYVPDAQFSADVDYATGQFRAEYGAVAALSTNYIAANLSMTVAATQTTFPADLKTKLGPFGRQLSFVAGAGAASVITLQGRDYMGQPIREQVTLNGATPVLSQKIYASLENFSWTANASSTAVNIGFTDVLGVPYRTVAVQNWFEDGVTASAGTLVTGAPNNVAQTVNSGDPRGSVDFATASNGVKTFATIGIADMTELYGIAHYAG